MQMIITHKKAMALKQWIDQSYSLPMSQISMLRKANGDDLNHRKITRQMGTLRSMSPDEMLGYVNRCLELSGTISLSNAMGGGDVTLEHDDMWAIEILKRMSKTLQSDLGFPKLTKL